MVKMMKIIQIGSYMMGAQKTIEEGIHQYAQEAGYSSRVLYVRGKSELSGVICCENRFENIITRALRRGLGKNPQFATLQTLRMISKIHRFRPDLVHLHVLHGGCINYELLLKYLVRMRLPVVYTMHDMWAHTGGCYHHVLEQCDGYRTGCSECQAEQQHLDELVGRVPCAYQTKKELLMRLNSLHCVTVSHWVAEEFSKGFLSGVSTSVIYNGVKQCTEESENIRIKREDNKIRIICSAMFWDQNKGLNTIMELAKLLDDRFEILVVGNVDEGSKRTAPRNVVFYGYCADRAHLHSLFRNSDIHVTASRAETFGMTLVEAAMAGIRSIGFACTAVKEVLEQVHGVAVEELTARGLFHAVIHVVDNHGNRLTVDEIQDVCDRFSIVRMAQEYIKLYETVVSSKK